MIVTWKDDDGIVHTGSADGRAYKRWRAAHPPAAPAESKPVTSKPAAPVVAPAPSPASEPSAAADPVAERKRK